MHAYNLLAHEHAHVHIGIVSACASHKDTHTHTCTHIRALTSANAFFVCPGSNRRPAKLSMYDGSGTGLKPGTLPSSAASGIRCTAGSSRKCKPQAKRCNRPCQSLGRKSDGVCVPSFLLFLGARHLFLPRKFLGQEIFCCVYMYPNSAAQSCER